MPKSSSPTAGSPELRSCAECRKRKSKCSGTAPCSYCSRAKKPCVFGRPATRTPLTRKNLDELERRCTRLTALLHKLNPGVDIEEASKTVSRSNGERNGLIERFAGVDPNSEIPPSPGSFEWNETPLASSSRAQKQPPDGMASLPTEGAESGYLGNSSGSSLLRTVSDLLPEHPSPHTARQEQTSPTNTGQTESPMLLSEHLINTALLDSLVDTYFTKYNSSYPILHEHTFRQKYQNRQLIQAHSSWHLVFYLVLAIGDWILNGGSDTERSRYYIAARSRMSMRLLESGTLLTVQAFLLVGNFLQKRDRPNTGYNFVGIAYRMALGLGLHREPPTGSSSDTLFNERRRVVWWILYSFDSGFSLTTGRPLMSPDCFIETRLPRNIDDTECTLDSTLPEPTEKPTTYSAIIAQARLASIGNMVYNDVISASNKPLDMRDSRSLDHQLKAWKLSLPVYFTAQDVPGWFRGPRAVVKWKEQNLRMMLWWGSQRLCNLSSDRQEAQNMCHYAAIEAIQDITTLCIDCPDAIHIGVNWYATYFLFQATVVLAFHHLRPCQPMNTPLAAANHELWQVSMSKARHCLEDLSKDSKAAARCLEVIDRIREQFDSTQPISTPVAEPQAPDSVPGSGNVHLPVDPSLQMFFDANLWNKDIFEGLQGFPISDEVEAFDYIPANTLTTNTNDGWAISTDPNLGPT